jgi:hypothetical protein
VAVAVPYRNDRIAVFSGGVHGSSPQFDVIGPLAHFQFTPELHQEAIGTSFTVKIYARDAAGNLLTGYGGSPSWSDGSGSLSPSSPAAFSGGVSTNPGTQIANPAHLDKITVDDASAGVQSSSHAFDAVGPFDHFTFSKIPQPLGVNQPFSLTVRAVDSAGNIVTGYTGSPTLFDYSSSLTPTGPAAFVSGMSRNLCVRVGAAGGDAITVDDAVAGVSSNSPSFGVTAAQVFSTPGAYTFTVPCAASVAVTTIGAAGGSQLAGTNGPLTCSLTPGGEGATVTGSLTLAAGAQLTAGVGGLGGSVDCSDGSGGSPGTGSGADGGAGGFAYGYDGGGGGGASFLSTGTAPPTASSLLLIGGGGGGAVKGGTGGNAGSDGSPQSGCPVSGVACGGKAGTSAGMPPDVGTGGAGDGNVLDTSGSDGGFLSGGAGGTGGVNAGGAGGGRYYGGGGGGAANGGQTRAGSGGGGQSFIAPSLSNTTGPTPTSNPAEVSITYAPPT